MTDNKGKRVIMECEEWYSLSLHEVTYSFGVSEQIIYDIIDEGIVTVRRNEKNELSFDNEALRRIRTALQLHRDLGVNLAGAALALELLNEIERLQILVNDKP
ncbi:chaperone modulator CbpM [Legionella spiritensis]|uniref:chaperone modulator CbpM n=1 Tax=Legionella spiritensis TaxID=452 RepID=UPI000F7206D0|nr:chaperone modulator CbpM [Legionella spiritensis]VEG91354.1 putative chaperone-modulator protein CbpM [Legionella spiritensis]